ncbi:adenylyltransferase/cytidyltransferase family protein [Methylobacterium hispanicum]|uniref:adenylyltransferase/cytidyltransferase family protein n=1 Tax=Methylobacterium hispanicum TaxID=270350 RepID=UPI002F342F0D
MSRIIGYTSGVYDLFHVGHLNILRNAKSLCDRLIVGVSTDELVKQYKNRTPIISFIERCEILQHVEYVDAVVAQDTMDKLAAWQRLKFNIMFVGDDWHGSDKWNKIDQQMNTVGVQVVYFPYTKSTSSTKIKQILENFDLSE